MICFDIDRPLLGVGQVPRAKKLQTNHKKFTKQWQILPCKKLGLAPPSCPSFSFRPEYGKQAAELQMDPQNRLLTVAMFPNGSTLGYPGLQVPLGTFFWIWVPFFVQGLRFLHFRLKNAKKAVKACIFC